MANGNSDRKASCASNKFRGAAIRLRPRSAETGSRLRHLPRRNIGGVKNFTPPICRSNYRRLGGDPWRDIHAAIPHQFATKPRHLACPSSATQMVILLAISVAVIFGIDRALDASRSRIAASRDTPAAIPGNCPQLAETFDSQRAACLRRRWSAMRNMRPWPDSSENAILEDCLRSPGGEIAVPFRTNVCNPPTTSPRLQAQN